MILLQLVVLAHMILQWLSPGNLNMYWSHRRRKGGGGGGGGAVVLLDFESFESRSGVK